MDADLRARAEAHLQQAAASLDLADPRPPLRHRLRQLRETDAAAFEQAIGHYETEVLPRLADDALGTWLDYARYLGELTGPGRLMSVDARGRAETFRPPVQRGTLVLYLPEADAADVIVAAAPLECAPPQQATMDLLVEKRLVLQDG
jgi:hypothetical protein